MDGPVVTTAKKALESGNVNLILPWAPVEAEGEIRGAFSRTMAARKAGKEAQEVADLWFFETVVRLHRAGEGAPYAGLKLAGLREGPVIPLAEEALEKGDMKRVAGFLSHALEEKLHERFHHAIEKKKYDENDVPAAREYVQAMLGFLLFSHHTYEYLEADRGHGGGHEHGE